MMTVTSRSEEEVFCDVPVAAEPAPVFDDVMIDIETMSLHRHKALILSIGMIEFDPSGKHAQGPGIADLRIGSRSLITPFVLPQLLLGRCVDVGTQKFWADQPREAAEHWLNAKAHHNLDAACRLVREFCAGKSRVWANGTQFDLSNLEGLAEDCKEPALWHYQAPRDMRTFIKETQPMRLVPIGPALDIPGVAHEPVHDCIAQAWQVWAHYQER